MEGLSMFDMMLIVPIYLIDSILSSIYTQSFLKVKYGKKAVSAAWGAAYFFIQIVVFEILGARFSISEVVGIILNVCILLFMQSVFFQKDMQKQFFVVFSFMAGKETVKYMISVFAIAISGLCDKILSHLVAGETINTIEKALVWIKISNVVFVVLWVMLYALLLYGYLYLVSKKYVKKN